MGEDQNTQIEQNPADAAGKSSRFWGISLKLLALTVVFIMLAEILIFVPSVANFRNVWLRTHLDSAEAASIVYLDMSDATLSDNAKQLLLDSALSTTIAVRRDGRSQMIAASGPPTAIVEHIDLDAASPFSSIASALGMLFQKPENLYRVFGTMRSTDDKIELVQEVRHIQTAMWRYARNILYLSLLISVFAAALVYLALYRLIVRPIIRISNNMDEFSKEPENASLIYKPTQRNDEIGIAEQRLSAFQGDLRNTLRQKQRLADLGLAVSKINHDLRNILASAQLFSDRLTSLPDPTVQRFAPKLIRTIDRAVDYTKSVLDYGKALEAPPTRRKLALRNLADDVSELLGLDGNDAIEWNNAIDPELEISADPEQLFRVMMNLCRNAVQAMQELQEGERDLRLSVSADVVGDDVQIRVIDSGPGIPEHIQPKLFNAFQGSTKSGGTGLGMAIAAELVHAHDGNLQIEKSGPEGTTFHIRLPQSVEAIEGSARQIPAD